MEDTKPGDVSKLPEETRFKRHLREWGLGYVVLTVLLAVVGGLITFAVKSVATDNVDKQYRKPAVATRMAEATRRTHGDVKLDGSYIDNWGSHEITVALKVGGCDAEGYFKSPRRPMSASDLSPLHILVPGIGDYRTQVTADLEVTTPDLYDRLLRSAMAQCVPARTGLASELPR